MVDKQEARRNNRKKNLTHLALGIAIVVLVNIIASGIYLRYDLTSEKKYTLSKATVQLLKQLDDYAYFKVYLEGDFPAGFKKLRNETRDMLEEFKAYSPYIEYQFINPSGIANTDKRNALMQELIDKGLQPTDLHVNKKEGSNRMLIFPGILLSYKGYEIPIELLQTQMGVSPEKVLNNSIESLEYNLASALLKLANNKKPTVAFLTGQQELQPIYLADIINEFSLDYRLGEVRINGHMSSLFKTDSAQKRITTKPQVDALIVAQPLKPFTEADKYILDQYVMYGGKIFWLIDPVFANMDSLRMSSETVGVKNELNLDDQLFKYGVRLNSDLLLDLNARSIPIVTGIIGNQPQQELLPWMYFPILIPQSDNPIVRNLNSIMTEFPSTLDTVEVKGVQKTILLQSSPYSRVVQTPAIIDLGMLENQVNTSLYETPPQNVAVLLNGHFPSLYANRIAPQLNDTYTLPPKADKSIETRMVVTTDGDIIKNQLHYMQHKPLPLGYDQFTQQTFGNKNFVVNVMNYLTQENGLIDIRSREIILRLLDKNKIDQNLVFIQFSNVVFPVLLISLLGLFLGFVRKRKYTVKKN